MLTKSSAVLTVFLLWALVAFAGLMLGCASEATRLIPTETHIYSCQGVSCTHDLERR
jgi:hypothetical protein